MTRLEALKELEAKVEAEEGCMNAEPNCYIATADDGSKWRILRDHVVADMIDFEAENNKWPRPISEHDVISWLGDNAESIRGWELVSVADPCMEGLSNIVSVFSEKTNDR